MEKFIGNRLGEAEHGNTPHGSLEATFIKALSTLNRLDSGEFSALTREYRTLHASCLELLAECLYKVEQIGLFSPNELIEDVSTNELKYMNLDFYLGKVIEKTPIDMAKTGVDARLSVCQLALRKYIEYLYLLDSYSVDADSELLLESVLPQGIHGTFNVSALDKRKNDRKGKTETHRKVRDISQALETAKVQVTTAGVTDEEKLREFELIRFDLHIAKSWEAISNLVQELNMLSGAAKAFAVAPFQERSVPYVPSAYLVREVLETGKNHEGPDFDEVKSHWLSEQEKKARELSTKVEGTGSANSLLSDSGKVNRPFVIAPNEAEALRIRLMKDVYGTGQKLPTITLEQLVDYEMKHKVKSEEPESKSGEDEDNEKMSDRKVLEARKWDEFVENNPRGSGNTLNRG